MSSMSCLFAKWQEVFGRQQRRWNLSGESLVARKLEQQSNQGFPNYSARLTEFAQLLTLLRSWADTAWPRRQLRLIAKEWTPRSSREEDYVQSSTTNEFEHDCACSFEINSSCTFNGLPQLQWTRGGNLLSMALT